MPVTSRLIEHNADGPDDDPLHDHLAARSSDAIHVIALDSGHFIYRTSPELVTAAVVEVVDAVRSGDGLAPCDDRFEDLGGTCA